MKITRVANKGYEDNPRLRHVEIFEAWENTGKPINKVIVKFYSGDLSISQRRFLMQNGLTNVPKVNIKPETFIIEYYDEE